MAVSVTISVDTVPPWKSIHTAKSSVRTCGAFQRSLPDSTALWCRRQSRFSVMELSTVELVAFLKGG